MLWKKLRRWALNPIVGPEALTVILLWKLLHAVLWPWLAFPKLVRESGWAVATFIIAAGGSPLILVIIGLYMWVTGHLAPS